MPLGISRFWMTLVVRGVVQGRVSIDVFQGGRGRASVKNTAKLLLDTAKVYIYSDDIKEDETMFK